MDGDFARLAQVFWNLLKNASKFSPEHSEIRILTQNENENINVSVSDSGIGFTPDKAAMIFDAFQQADDGISRQFGGLGLGLSIARAAVQAHDGHLSAVSEGDGKGATFHVSLPLAHRDGHLKNMQDRRKKRPS